MGLGLLGVGLAGSLALVALAVWGVWTYNHLVAAEAEVQARWAQVENQLQRRLDLVPNLVETVKGMAGHEASLHVRVAEARQRMLASSSPGPRVLEAARFDAEVRAVRVHLMEAYPEARADRHFTALMDELVGTENRLAVERKRYNDAAAAYNLRLRQLPGSMVAGVAGLAPRPLLEAAPEAAAAPAVRF